MPFDANDPEAKAAIKEAVEAAVEAAKSGLETKNQELLDDLKKTKAELRKVKDIDPADHAKLEAEVEKLTTELATANKTAKDATTAAEKAAKALADESTFTHKLIAENGVVAALTAANVTDPAYLDAAKALHLGNVKVVADGAERKAMYGDKPLAEAIKEWAAGDVGKKFVAAPVNGGGGAPGGKGSGEGGKAITQEAHDAMSPKDRAAHFAAGGTIAAEA